MPIVLSNSQFESSSTLAKRISGKAGMHQAGFVVTHSPVNCTSVLYIPNMSYHVMPLTRNTNNALLTEECRTEWCNLIG